MLVETPARLRMSWAEDGLLDRVPTLPLQPGVTMARVA
jgi:hypothetical protein